MSDLPEVNEAEFENEVLKSQTPVLVEFGAVWCAPCKMLDPIVSELAREWAGKLKVFKLDIDHNPDVPMTYQVMSVPTMMLFKNGEVLERMVGFKPKEKIVEKIAPHL